MHLHRLIIGCPFGNWLSFPGATSTMGTFTLHYRGGLLYRLWRCLLTLRYRPLLGGWSNQLGLPNPGIVALNLGKAVGKIVSIHGFSECEWMCLVERLRGHEGGVELNLSCPNVGHEVGVKDVLCAVDLAQHYGLDVIAKLPPLRWLEMAAPLFDAGVRCFHCCNTLPVFGGGLSGKGLKPYSLRAVEGLRRRYGDGIRLIGGGGVTCEQDYRDYRNAGADHVAVASVLINPLNWGRIRRLAARVRES